MSTEGHGDRTPVGEGPDYKILFLGACSLVVVLGGGAFRVWDTAAERANNYSEQALHRLEQRIDANEQRGAANEERLSEGRYDRAQLRRQLDDHEERLRAIEQGRRR